jgi:hypothetical protein
MTLEQFVDADPFFLGLHFQQLILYELIERVTLGEVILVTGLKQLTGFFFLQLVGGDFVTANLGNDRRSVLSEGNWVMN